MGTTDRCSRSDCEAAAATLFVRHRDIEEYRAARKRWDAAHPPMTPVTAGDLIDNFPDDAPWCAVCDAHYPHEESTYSFEYPKTDRSWLSWTAHLMGKEWLEFTNWVELIERVAHR